MSMAQGSPHRSSTWGFLWRRSTTTLDKPTADCRLATTLKEQKSASQQPLSISDDDQARNPIGEARLLMGHTDIVRHICRLPGPSTTTRYATAGDDNTIFVWNPQELERKQVLKGHQLPVTCLVPWRRSMSSSAGCTHSQQQKHDGMQEHPIDISKGVYTSGVDLLLSGSIDRTIKVWNLADGSPLHTWTTKSGCVKAMVVLDIAEGICVAGGKDIYAWHLSSGALCCHHTRNKDKLDISLMLALPNHHIVTVAEDNVLTVRRVTIEEHICRHSRLSAEAANVGTSDPSIAEHLTIAAAVTLVHRLNGHTERIECLSEVFAQGTMFASGSLDGTVRVWSAQGAFNALTICNPHDVYKRISGQSDIEAYLYRVHDITVVGHLVIAAIDRGFAVFDAGTGKQIDEVQCAHHAHVTTLAALGTSGVLVTGSSDSSVRIWDISSCDQELFAAPMSSGYSSQSTESMGRTNLHSTPGDPRQRVEAPAKRIALLGEVYAHSSQVNALTPTDDGLGFLSCGSDKLVLLWGSRAAAWRRSNAQAHCMVNAQLPDEDDLFP
eukprot:m.735626 g.735626  ORF g.735626 m.735626 type:complete len:552 (+) comp23091_c0_seq9:387-2042(+)